MRWAGPVTRWAGPDALGGAAGPARLSSGALACITTEQAPSSPVGRQVLILPLLPFLAFLLFLCLEENGNIQQFRKTESGSER